jgi:hypothetical protein
MKHARINLNTGEAYEPPSARELIERQIEEAAEMLCDVTGPFERPREIANGIIGIAQTVERLLQVVQNHQAQIEELQEARAMLTAIAEIHEGRMNQ